MDYPRVHIIILTWNHWEVTASCLDSLSRLSYPNCSIIVIDNGSTDETVARIRQEYPAVYLIENGRNLGFAAGCNVGLRHALDEHADYVFLLNNDTIVPPDLLEVLVARAESLPRLGILAPLLRYGDNPDKLWFTGSRRHPLTLEAVGFGPLGPRSQNTPDRLRPVDYIFGTAMLIPRRALQEAGLFDEAFFMYYEDMDLCIRMQALGYGLYCTPEVSLTHQVSASTGVYSPFRHYHKARSGIIFFRKHTNLLRRLFIILPYRTASALRTALRLSRKREWATLGAFFRGLAAGLRTSDF